MSRVLRPTSHGNSSLKERLPADSFGLLLARARIAARLSQRELANLAGVSNSTLAQIERGDDPRWDTMRRIGSVLPGLSAAEMLAPKSRHPPQASVAAANALREMLGIGCESMSLRVILQPSGPAQTELEIDSCRLAARMDELMACTTLMRATCAGSPRFVRSLDASQLLDAGGTLRLTEAEHEHHFELTRGRRPSLTYRRIGPGISDMPFARATAEEEDVAHAGEPRSGVSHQVSLPTRKLHLEIQQLRSSPSLRPEIRAWMSSGMIDAGASNLARRLYPGGVGTAIERSGTTTRATIQHPMLAVGYSLVLVGRRKGKGKAEHQLGDRSRTRLLASVGESAAATRRGAELSLRGMADRLGVSWATVRQFEAGRQPRASTMQRYLREFPDLAPQDLLPIEEAEATLSQAQLWDYYVRLFGFCADEVEKTVRVRRDGSTQTTIVTRRIRAQVGSGSTLSLRLGLGRAVMSDQPAAPLEAVRASSEKMRLSTFKHRDGKVTHQFTFPSGLFAKGATYRRAYAWKKTYFMFEERAMAGLGGLPPYEEATSITLQQPARALKLVVLFPPGYLPREFVVHAWPEAHVPDLDVARVLDLLPQLVHSAKLEDRRARAVLRVDHPLVGVRYAMAWQLPARGGRKV